MGVLSIQSSVAVGHVGNSAAVFPMQRLGFEVWALATVLYSNHPGYDSFGGDAVSSHTLKSMIDGIESLNNFGDCQAVLSGYLATLDNAKLVIETVERIKAKKPDCCYCCDPVIGDAKRQVYIPTPLAEFMRDELVMHSDLLTPNIFELEYLSGRAQNSLSDALFAADSLRAKGPKTIMITSVPHHQGEHETLSNLIVSDQGAWRVSVPKLPLRAHGTGDALTALYLAHILRGEQPRNALELATSSLHGVIDDTVRNDSDELRLIPAQAEYLNPSFYMDAERVG